MKTVSVFAIIGGVLIRFFVAVSLIFFSSALGALVNPLTHLYPFTRTVIRRNLPEIIERGFVGITKNIFTGDEAHYSGFPSLPNNCSERAGYQQTRYTFRPCEEYVPPWRVGLAALCLLGMFGCAYEGASSRGWFAGLCAFNVVALALFAAYLVVSHHKYDCDNKDEGGADHRQSSQHGAEIERVMKLHTEGC